MPDDRRPDSADDDVGTLVRLAGLRAAPPPNAAARVHVAVKDEWRQLVRGRGRRRLATWSGLGLLAAAAALILVLRMTTSRQAPVAEAILVGVVERINGRVTLAQVMDRVGAEALAAGRSVPRGATIHTGPRSYAGVRIASGGRVRLDADTQLRLTDHLTLELERGAIYIDVGPDADHGLLVRTPFGTARDIGTRFEVRLTGASLRVRVRDGLVQLEHRGRAHEASARDELTASADGTLVRRVTSTSGPDWDWTVHAAPPFVLEGRALSEFLTWVEREGGYGVRILDPSVQPSTIVLHGSLDGLTPQEALAVVLPTCGLAHRVEGDRVIVERVSSKAGRL